MDSGWQRETRVCATVGLRPDLLVALRTYLELHEIDGVEAAALVCFETVSRRSGKPSLMERMGGAGHKSMTQAVIVTPTRLVWAQAADDDEAYATSELLVKLEVTDYEKGPAFSLMPDHGVEISGVAAGQGRVGTQFFGLGEGPDADRARHMLTAAVKTAHGEGPPVGSPE
jgi:hypothetical protein